jgi:hypothetical protein
VNQPTTGQQVFREVLKSDTLFPEDVHNERNKAYYTIDLSSVLDGTNPKKEVFVRFTDGSTADGWGPGVFWMALHSGGLEVNSDRSVFGTLKSVNGEPNYGGVNLIYRRYALDSGKVLKEIVLPADSTLEASKVYLLGATLNSAQPSGSPELKWKVQSTGLQLSWPASPSGFGLQSAGSVLGPWSADSAPVVAQGTDSTVLITPIGGPRFFRLVKQP